MLIEKLDKVNQTSLISPGLSSGIIGVFAFMGPIISIKLFQKVGRKGIWVGGLLGCCIFHLFTAISYSLENSIMCLLSMACMVFVWQMTIGCVYFVYVSEVLCGAAIGMANFIQLLSLCSVAYLSPMIIQKFDLNTIFYSWSIIQIIPLVLFSVYMKETKGLDEE